MEWFQMFLKDTTSQLPSQFYYLKLYSNSYE